MKEQNNVFWVIGLVACIIAGLVVGWAFAPTNEVEVIKEVQVPVEKIVEVVKEVKVSENYVENALNDFLNELENDDDFDQYLECDSDRYDFDQISVNKVYDDASVSFSEVDTDDLNNAEAYTVEFSTRLKYSDSDVEEKCYNTFDVSVDYEEGETPEVSVA